ncbi:MAG: DUF2911 domain-containing protein [Ignavibacteriales bacterium]|nr:DUF2911 domain-containing protein [Ignavibacteriales bacterium]
MRFNKFFIAAISFLIILSITTIAQQENKPRQSLKASVSQRIGVDNDITIIYSRPGVKGRKIWDDLVPYGLAPGNKNSNNNPFPWRGGANENTTIEFGKDVTVEGNKLPAGKYGLHFIPGEKNWIIIFSKNNSNWGSFTYNQKDDALRITVTAAKAPFEEWLTYGFDDLNGNSATAFLKWEELKVQFKIATVK